MTRSKILSATVIASIGAILLVLAPGTAFAGIDGHPNNGAMVFHEGDCFWTSAATGGTVFADNVQAVFNQNWLKLTCHFFGVPNTTGGDVNFNENNSFCTINDIDGTHIRGTLSFIEGDPDTGNLTIQCRAPAPQGLP